MTEKQQTFRSYAQVKEDIVLFQALGNLPTGFYIDVGAHDPIVDSVTKVFYERGWHGINIEPVKHWFDKLVDDRPNDTNLNIAAGSREGTIKLFEVVDTGLSTANKEFAQRHKQQGFAVQEISVEVTTLNNICAKEQVSEIQFLKIDVEGLEKEVLEGLDLSKIRPWIILIEAMEPLSHTPTWQTWEHIILGASYSYIKSDGLNRFYLAKEHETLRDALLKD